MSRLKKLPIGIEDFTEMRTEDFYFVDKTALIKELLENWGKVNLFTRPRRFGKTMNMSMLKSFFEIGCRRELFEGLAISGEKEICEKYMGKYPVIFVTLKDIEGRTFDEAFAAMRNLVGITSMKFSFLKESKALSSMEKEQYEKLVCTGRAGSGMFDIAPDALEAGFRTLSMLLARHYKQKVIILIDEYDVPLDKAAQFGYYEEMVSLLRKIFGNALKTNEDLYFAVMTGCLRVSKESIFTGLNNLSIHSITNMGYNEYFGFTDEEVQAMLAYYGLMGAYESVKAWYDGYLFGDECIYCPWDVINYCNECRALQEKNPNAVLMPKNYWVNTSGNAIIRTLLADAKGRTKSELETLIAGEVVEKRIDENLTYSDIYDSTEHIWGILFATGYLTYDGISEDNVYRLRIPNQEIRNIFVNQIMKWFETETKSDPVKLDFLCNAVLKGNTEAFEENLNDFLKKSISIRDIAGKEKKENFYHGILLGLLGHREEWQIRSNAESGDGYSDILLLDDESETGIVIEIKYTDAAGLEAGCREALAQIRFKHYESLLEDAGMTKILKYGAAFCRKKCRIVCER